MPSTKYGARQVHGFAERQRPLEHAYGLGQCPLAQEEMAKAPHATNKTVRVIDRLGQPDGVLGVCPPLGKRTSSARQRATCARATTDCMFVVPKRSRSSAPCRISTFRLYASDRLPVVVQNPQVELTQEAVGGGLQADVPQGCGNSQRALGGRESSLNVALIP